MNRGGCFCFLGGKGGEVDDDDEDVTTAINPTAGSLRSVISNPENNFSCQTSPIFKLLFFRSLPMFTGMRRNHLPHTRAETHTTPIHQPTQHRCV